MLYAFGSNGSGQLGVGHTDDLSKPEAIVTGDSSIPWTVKQLAAGGNHTVVLCSDGKVKATGNNEDGRCGLGETKQTTKFTEVALPLGEDGSPLQVKQVATSWSATNLLCSDGCLYVCGTGYSGELGLGTDVKIAASLKRLPDFPPLGTEVLFITSGMAHTVAILSNQDVYGWGKGREGQVGEPAHDVWTPRRIDGLEFGATQAACGKDFTLIVGESSTGQTAVLGAQRRDRFGIRTTAPSSLLEWKSISASWGSAYALRDAGCIAAWGRDDHGQLPPRDLPEIEAVAAGSEHCLALTKAGKVLAWGWGEHGNCGEPTDEQGDVKLGWNEIEIAGRASKIFAGCATSFVEAEQ